MVVIHYISQYESLRFNLNQEFQTIKLVYWAVLYIEFIRMPALTNTSTGYKNLRVVGAQNWSATRVAAAAVACHSLKCRILEGNLTFVSHNTKVRTKT